MNDEDLKEELYKLLSIVKYDITVEELYKVRERIIGLMRQMPCNDTWGKACLYFAISSLNDNVRLLYQPPRGLFLQICLLSLLDSFVPRDRISNQFLPKEKFELIDSLSKEDLNKMINEVEKLI